MPFHITRQGDIVRGSANESMVRPKQTIEMLLFDPAARLNVNEFSPIFLDAGFNARGVLNRIAAPQSDYRFGRTPVAPSVLDHAKENPIGVAGRFIERAVDTLIVAAVGAGANHSWSLDDSRSAFAIAFGLDKQSCGLRDQLLGASVDWPSSSDDSLPTGLRDQLATPIDFGAVRDPTGPRDDFSTLRPLDDLFQRTCVLGVFDALHEFGRTIADAPREYMAARITKLEPDRGCTGDRIEVRGTGFGATQAPGLDLVFPTDDGGWFSIDVAPVDWSDTEITVTLPAGVGVGLIGFVQVNPNATPATEAAGRLAGEMGACFGPVAQGRAQTTIAKFGGLGKVSITETPFNRFRGGRPMIDYFLANGAQKADIRPGGPLLLQWSVINADTISVRKAAGAPAELPAIPNSARNAHDEIRFSAVHATGSWDGSYEIVATNPCGQVTQVLNVQMRSRKALALAGGGSKGAFEVGAVRCLYDVFGYQPDLLTGASVGALNATKLAEGAAALPELEKLWLDMVGPEDLFYIRGQIKTILTQLDPAIHQALQLTPLEDLLGWSAAPTSTAILNLNIAGRTLGFLNSNVASAAGAGTLFTIFDIVMAGLDIGLKIGKIAQAIQQLLLLPSLLLFDPVRDKIQANITPSKIVASGLALRIVVNGLRTARVRYVDENGAFVDGGPAPGVIAALNASAAIPIAFPPVRLPDGEDYVDGGVLENAPIEAAVRAGADSIIAILPSPAEIDVPLNVPTTLLPVAGRAVELLLDGSSRRQLEPFRGWGVPVKIIAPRFEPYNLLVVDPGLIRINMDYGYLRAYDEMQSDESLRAAYRTSSDAITKLRQTVWYQEHWVHAQYPKGFIRTGQIQPTGSAEQVEWIREKKKEIRDLVVARVGLTGASVKASVPTSIDKAWREWEAHFFSVYFNTPWDGFTSYPGRVLQPEPPPPLLP
jgi:predicted acylesterase/phospholipase RssA